MVKKLRIVIGLIFLVVLCAGLAACKTKGELEKYDVCIYYDSNGGSYYDRTGITVVDGFRFDDFEADENGDYKFKLLEPTSSSRPANITLTKPKSFFAGWYRTRNELKDSEGRLLDDENRPLTEVDGSYVVLGTENDETPVKSYPAYTYDGRWDFENDYFICNKDSEDKQLRLYAGWVPYYYFNYNYKDESGNWVKYAETYFNYDAVANDPTYSDYNTIWTPDWSNGIMEHSHNYSDGKAYKFPKLNGYTFVEAYTDAKCTNKIESSFTHTGTLDLAHAKPENRVQEIYVKVDKGERFRIDKAEQLADSKNVLVDGIYTILNDLVFSDSVKWPATFATGTFTGTFQAEEGKTVAISGAQAIAASDSVQYGGLFGRVGDGAVIKGISFKNAQLTVANTYNRQECSFGLFSGQIDGKASVTSVTVGGTIKLGQILSNSTCSVNMLVCGENKGGVSVDESGIKLQVYGDDFSSYYSFSINPDKTTVESDGNVNITFTNNRTERQKEKEIYDITTWRQ